MSLAKRVVLDASTLISAALLPTSIPRQALLAALASATVCVSPATLDELEHVLLRDKFDPYLDHASRSEFLALYRHHARLFNVTVAVAAALPQVFRNRRDSNSISKVKQANAVSPKKWNWNDNKFLALAINCSADALVSSDDDLLVLNPYQGISILSPKEFLG